MAFSRNVLVLVVSGWAACAPLAALNPTQRAAVAAIQYEATQQAETKLRVHNPSLATLVLTGQAGIPLPILTTVWPLAKPETLAAQPPPWAGSVLPRMLQGLDKASDLDFCRGMARYVGTLAGPAPAPYFQAASLAPGDVQAVAAELSRTLGVPETSWQAAVPLAVTSFQVLVAQADRDLNACLNLWVAQHPGPGTLNQKMVQLVRDQSQTRDPRARINLFKNAFR